MITGIILVQTKITNNFAGNNVNNLLELSDRYQVKVCLFTPHNYRENNELHLITDLAEEFLIKSADDMATKLYVAETYRLTKLKVPFHVSTYCQATGVALPK